MVAKIEETEDTERRALLLGCAGDDCISIQDGCSDLFIRSVRCGPGHGISIGGLGKGGASAVVSGVTVQDVTLNQTMTGLRIKTWQVDETSKFL